MVCLKVFRLRDKISMIVVPKRMDPIIFDLETENILMTLPFTSQSSLVNCITVHSNFVFCCDNRKKIHTFDMNNAKPINQPDICTYAKTDWNTFLFSLILRKLSSFSFISVPSSAISSYYDGKRFLILGCIDGVIRALDMSRKPNRLFVLPGPHMKSLTCMKVSGDKVWILLKHLFIVLNDSCKIFIFDRLSEVLQ